MPPDPYFHADTDCVRFWVTVGDLPVGASIARRVLAHGLSNGSAAQDPLQTYTANAAALADAVRRRVAGGSIEPVMIREADLAGPRSP